MNALELADQLEVASSEMEYNHIVSDWKLLYESAIVLRKQADKITELENILSMLLYKRLALTIQKHINSMLIKCACFQLRLFTTIFAIVLMQNIWEQVH